MTGQRPSAIVIEHTILRMKPQTRAERPQAAAKRAGRAMEPNRCRRASKSEERGCGWSKIDAE
jgi:hypothetical protein